MQCQPLITRATTLLNRAAPASDKVLKGAQNPTVKEALRKGQEAHRTFQYPAGYRKEAELLSGKRIDALNEATKHVFELKPNNPAAIMRGQKQLEGYLDELNITRGGGWTGDIITYTP